MIQDVTIERNIALTMLPRLHNINSCSRQTISGYETVRSSQQSPPASSTEMVGTTLSIIKEPGNRKGGKK
jgi:hypothetical protein